MLSDLVEVHAKTLGDIGQRDLVQRSAFADYPGDLGIVRTIAVGGEPVGQTCGVRGSLAVFCDRFVSLVADDEGA